MIDDRLRAAAAALAASRDPGDIGRGYQRLREAYTRAEGSPEQMRRIDDMLRLVEHDDTPSGRPTADRSEESVGDFWAALSEPERAALSTAGATRSFKPGRLMLAAGDTPSDVLVLRSGHVKVHTAVAGDRDLLLALRGPGDILGEEAIDIGRRTASVTAIDMVTALEVPVGRFTGLLDRSAHASEVLRRVLVKRLWEADRHRLTVATTNVAQRLARLLLDLASRYGVPADEGGIRVALALTQTDLAALIGASPRAVGREIERWRDREIVATGRRWVLIRQAPALARVAGQPFEHWG